MNRPCLRQPRTVRVPPPQDASRGSMPGKRARAGGVAPVTVVARVASVALVACLPLVAFSGCGSRAPAGPIVEPTPEPGDSVWQDEFNGPAGATFDRVKWTADTGGAGFGNNELEFYTTDTANVALDGQGHLVITARAEPTTTTKTCWYGRCRYTSARLKTQDRFEQLYGRFEARIRVPRGQGVWPAFWLLGNDIGSVGWPTCGEIDVMENIGREPNLVHGTMHGPGYSGGNGIGRPDTLPAGAFADDFHVFAIVWQPGDIRWFVDGHEYHHVTPADLPPGTRWVFDHPFFILLNFAVGGDWPGSPDASTAFPQQMVVDYVRVYRNPAGG